MSNAITVDQKQVDDVVRLLNGVKTDATVALMRSLNRTAAGAKTAAAKGVGGVVTMKAKEIKSYIRVSKAKKDHLSSSIHLKQKLTPAIVFTNRQLKKGISLKIYKAGSSIKLKHDFYATMNSGHRGIFRRAEISPGVYAGRLPIIERFGPSVGAVYEKTPGLSSKIEAESSERLLREVDSQVNAILNRYA